MKKKLALFASVLLAALSLSACGGESGEKEVSAYEKYIIANAKIAEADVSEMAMIMDMKMYAEGAEDQAMSMQTNGLIQASNMESGNVEFAMSIETSSMGQEMATDMYYKDGYMYLSSPEGNYKMAMDIETAMEQIASSEMATFPEDAIKDTKEEEKDGNTIYTFTIDGTRMTEILGDMVAQLTESFGGEGTEIVYKDLLVAATIDENDNMIDCNMLFSASITAEGQTILVDYDIIMNDIKTEGVTIEFPEDLDTYEELGV